MQAFNGVSRCVTPIRKMNYFFKLKSNTAEKTRWKVHKCWKYHNKTWIKKLKCLCRKLVFSLPSHKLNLLLPVSKLLSTTSTLGFPLKKDIWANSTFTDISNIETGREREREYKLTYWIFLEVSWAGWSQPIALFWSLVSVHGHLWNIGPFNQAVKYWYTTLWYIGKYLHKSRISIFQRSYWVWIYAFMDGRENCYDKEVANPRPDRPNPTTILLMVAS